MYRIFDEVVESDFPLPELETVTAAAPTLRVLRRPGPDRGKTRGEWLWHATSPGSTPWLSCASHPEGFFLRCGKGLDFVVDVNRRSITVGAHRGYPENTLRHMLLDQVTPRLLGQEGRLVLHASAIVLPGGAVAFAGPSGGGKSTLAASFHDDGDPLLTDDCLLLDTVDGKAVGISAYQASRLWPDAVEALFEGRPASTRVAHYSSKTRMVLGTKGGLAQTSNPVQAMFLLEEAGEEGEVTDICVEPVSGGEVLMAAVRRSFLFDATDLRVVERQFYKVAEIAQSGTRLFRLRYPRQHALLPAVRRAVRDAVSELQGCRRAPA